MGYTLTLRDTRQAGECARVLAMPFDFGGFEDWSREASESLQSLLGGDKATFAITDGGKLYNLSEVIPPSALREYIDHYLICDKWGMLTRSLALGAFNRNLVYAGHRKEILNSVYWNELIRPARAFDTVGLTATVGKRSDIANLQFYHDQENGPHFGQRGLALLRAVYPAFAAGCRTWAALHTYSRQLSSLIDAMPVGVVLSDSNGSILHENPASRRVLGLDSPKGELRNAIRVCIDQFRRDWNAREPAARSLRPRVTSSDVLVTGHTYRLSTSFLGREIAAGSGAIVVVIEPIGPRPFPAEALRDRYQLTKREIEVARLLAEGKSNPEIACALGVSRFTARHHTESVMLKLGVTARGKVAVIIAALTAG